MSDSANLWKGVCAFLLIPLVFAARGYALVSLWLWFVVPLGVHPITFWWSFGLALVVGMFKTTPKSNDDDADKIVIRLAGEVFACFVVLGVGALVHHFATIG